MTKHQSRLQRYIATFMVALMLMIQPVAAVLADSDPASSTGTATTTPTTSDSGSGSATTPDSSSGSGTTTPTTPTTGDSGSGTTTTPPATSPTTPTTTPATPAAPSSPAPSPTTGPQGSVGPQGTVGPGGPTGQAPDYAFNDATQKWDPTIISSFSWSTTANNWVSPFYRYDPVTGWWHVIPAVTPSDAIAALTAGSADPAALLDSILGTDPSNTNTGPNSDNSNTLTTSQALLASLINSGGIYNNITSDGASGDAGVSANTAAGDATTGAVSVVTNLLNLLNAMWTFSGSGMAYFVQNIFGNQTGDVNINTGTTPAATTAPVCSGGSLVSNADTGSSSTNTAADSCDNALTVNSQTNGAIVNNVGLDAQSGNASVTGNTQGGSAQSGDALAELNLVNLIDTAIGSSQSFFGIINIYGNLDGDILFPQLDLNGAVASSSTAPTSAGSVSDATTGPDSTNTASNSNTNTANVTNSANADFNNNVNATATTGNADVSDNTSAGSATSGAATTNNSLFNLFYTNVFGDNAVLVIVNDMGTWVGQLLDLSGVSDSSGGGLLTSNATVTNTDTGPGSTNTASNSNTNTANLNNSVNGTITNNVNAAATSGSATVSDNTSGGNATSGNATVASDIANIFSSTLQIAHTFGILFINVFGSWTGSVGMNTAAGDSPAATTTSGSGGLGGGLVSALSAAQGIAPAGSGGSSSTGSSQTSGGSQAATSPGSLGAIAGTGSLSGTALVAAAQSPSQAIKTATKTTGLLLVLAAVTILLAISSFGLERRLRR